MIHPAGLLMIVVAYLLGSLPSGYWLCKQFLNIDIREHGSGNIGATNVKRVAGPRLGTITLVCDFLKGFVAVLLASILFPDPVPVLAGFAAILGHSRSIFIGFKGGKAVITTLGVFMVLEPGVAIVVGAIAIGTMKLTRIVSVGSMLGAVLTPLAVWLTGGRMSHLALAVFISLYIVWLHRANIVRLLRREENRL